MHLLPQSLMALLVASPTWAGLESPPNLTTPVDLFFHIRRKISLNETEPVCCLRPLEPQEPTPELLSFDEWKEKQRKIDEESKPIYTVPQEMREQPNETALQDSSNGSSAPLRPAPEEHTSPVFHLFNQVPLKDRFNYASEDCSARIHKSHDTARSGGAVLSSKKDKYMLSPCSTEGKFIIVELCDDIRIDTVQLANFEFFSGVFRDLKISVTQTYTSDTKGWVEMGTYEAENVRGVQTFHPQTELRPFYRYIRIDYLSHYGNEYYCPVSLLRVYGLTQMEEWKLEVWEAEWRAKRSVESVESVVQKPETTVEVAIPVPWPMSSDYTAHGNVADAVIFTSHQHGTTNPEIVSRRKNIEIEFLRASSSESAAVNSTPGITSPAVTTKGASTSSATTPVTSALTTVVDIPLTAPITTSQSVPLPSHNSTVDDKTSETSTPLETSKSSTQSMEESSSPANPNAQSPPPPIPSSATLKAASIPPSATTSSPLANLKPTTPLLIPAQSVSSVPSGESVFRTIANRITVLENNYTLYVRYVEEQTKGVRDALRKLEEDVGRLEGISKSQQSIFHKAVNELVKQRQQLEGERLELISKVDNLASEVVLEKRLGIAQMILLFTVLVFMSITRGSRGEAFFEGTANVVKRLSTRPRVVSLSGDWGRWHSRSASLDSRRDRKSSRTSEDLPTPVSQGSEVQRKGRQFISHQSSQGPTNGRASSASVGALTPRYGYRHLPATSHNSRVATPNTSRFPATRPKILHRSSSQSGPQSTSGFAQRLPFASDSPRRLAQTAHIHEVKRKSNRQPTHEEDRRDAPLNNLTNYLEHNSITTVTQHSRRKRRSSGDRASTPVLGSLNKDGDCLQTWREGVEDMDERRSREVDSEQDVWVDTDYLTEDGVEPTQELIIAEDVQKRAKALISLSSPPQRRSSPVRASP